MRIGIIHSNLDGLRGGSERVCVSLMDILKLKGHEIHLVSNKQPDWKNISQSYNKNINVDKIYTLPALSRFLGIYRKFFFHTIGTLILDVDLIVNTDGDAFPILGSKKVSYISYCHFPTLALPREGWFRSKYESNLFWKQYFKIYLWFVDRWMKSGIKQAKILTNSEFSKKAIYTLYGKEALVVQPPVDVRSYNPLADNTSREDIVVVLSRITEEKRLEKALYVLKKLPSNIELVIIGSLSSQNKAYFHHLKNLAKKLGIERRVTFRPNATLPQLLENLSHAKVYMHTMEGEHFGISIVEAMASGLIPIVPNYGGQTEFVPERWQYSDLDDAAEKIVKALTVPHPERLCMRKIVQRFSERNFARSVLKVIHETMDN